MAEKKVNKLEFVFRKLENEMAKSLFCWPTSLASPEGQCKACQQTFNILRPIDMNILHLAKELP